MKSFSVNKSQLAIICTVLSVLFLGASYFYIYIPNNEDAIQEQRFRSLQNIVNNVHAKLDNSAAQLNNLLVAYQISSETENVKRHIKKYPTENFKIYPVKVFEKKGSPLIHSDQDSVLEIKVDDISNQIDLILSKKNKDKVYQIQLRYTLQQFSKHLFPEDIFDEYVIFNKDKLVYESFPSGLNYGGKDSLLNKKRAIGPVASIQASGKEYKAFLQPVSLNAGNSWLITGLLSNKRYQEEKNQLPTNMVLLLLTIGLAIVLAFPWIKIYQMGSRDRLTVFDGVSTIVVSMLLISMLSFIFCKYNALLKPDTERSKMVLAAGIKDAFNKELQVASNALIGFDSVRHIEKKHQNLVNLGSDSLRYENGTGYLKRKDLELLSFGLKINQVFWLKSDGQDINSWQSSTEISPLSNFSNRDYFKNIKAGKGNYTDIHGRRFFLDQVISVATGTFTSVLATESVAKGKAGDALITVMSLNLKSLDHAILTPGYQFAIIDQKGKVLYHSQAYRNLNENLMSEFSESNKLSSSLAARSEASFTTDYFSNQFKVFVSPISKLPYSIVILEDKNYKDTRDMEVYSFTLSMLLCWSVFLMLQLIVIFFVSSKRSFLKKQIFDTSWVGPKISAQPQYNLCGLGNIVIAFLLACFFPFCGFLDYLLILIIAVTQIALFQNIVFYRKYRRDKRDDYRKLKEKAGYALSVFLALANIAGLFLLTDTMQHLLLFQLFSMLCLGALLFCNRLWFVKKLKEKFLFLSYTQSFALMTVTRLVVTSGVPMAAFYIASYNYEHNLSTRYRQVQFAVQLTDKYPRQQAFEGLTGSRNYTSAVYIDSTYINGISDTIIKSAAVQSTNAPAEYSDQDLRTFAVLSAFRLGVNSSAVQMDDFSRPILNEGTLVYDNLLSQNGQNAGRITYKKVEGEHHYIKLSSADLSYKFPGFIKFDYKSICKGVLFWLLLAFVYYLFMVIFNNLIKKLFSVNLPDQTGWAEIDKTIMRDVKLNRQLFMIGAPGSGKANYVQKLIREKKFKLEGIDDFTIDKVFVADMILLPETEAEAKVNEPWLGLKKSIAEKQPSLVIINHFEYNIKNSEANRTKLDFLETLLQLKFALIIISTVHPVSFLDSFNQRDNNGGGISEQDMERWNVLLGHFRIIIQPIQKEKQSNIPISDWENKMKEETGYSHFLRDMHSAIVKRMNKQKQPDMPVGETLQTPVKYSKEPMVLPDDDSLAFKLQITSHYFYMYIWQSLTREEKFLLYDLAEDGLVNPYDDYNLVLLIMKGIVVRNDGTLKIFNKGFRNFILTAIGHTEALKIKNEIKENGNWSQLRIPLIIIILAIFGFLFASQQEAYSKLITYITGLAAGVPVIMKLFSLFDKNTDKQG